MIKQLIRKHDFVDSDLNGYTLNADINSGHLIMGTIGMNTINTCISMNTTTMWSPPNQFIVSLDTGVGQTTDNRQLILDDGGTLTLTNRVQHVGSVFFDNESRELKTYNGTEWVTIQQL